MKIKFTKDFANNWRAGEVVDVKYIGHGDVLVDNVARIFYQILRDMMFDKSCKTCKNRKVRKLNDSTGSDY